MPPARAGPAGPGVSPSCALSTASGSVPASTASGSVSLPLLIPTIPPIVPVTVEAHVLRTARLSAARASRQSVDQPGSWRDDITEYSRFALIQELHALLPGS